MGIVDGQLDEKCGADGREITYQGKTPENRPRQHTTLLTTKEIEDSDLGKTTKSLQDKEKYENEKWYHVDTDILPAKFCYFFDLPRKFSTNIAMILFLTQIGLDKQEAGLILGFRFVTNSS